MMPSPPSRGYLLSFPFPFPSRSLRASHFQLPGQRASASSRESAKRQAEGARGPWADALTREEPHVNKRGSVTAAR